MIIVSKRMKPKNKNRSAIITKAGAGKLLLCTTEKTLSYSCVATNKEVYVTWFCNFRSELKFSA